MAKKTRVVLIMMLVMMLILVGCSSDDEAESTAAEETQAETETVEEEEAEVEEVEEVEEEVVEEEAEEETVEETVEEVEEEEPVDLGELGDNLLTSPDFSAALSENQPDGGGNVDTEGSWTFHTNNGADGTAEMDGALVKVSPTNVNSPAYGIQLIQAPMTVESGAVYEVMITAKAEADRDIFIKIGGTASKGWVAYGESTVKLTADMSTTTFEFTMNGETDENARFELWFAQSDIPVWVESVSMKKYSNTGEISEDTMEEESEEMMTVAPGENMIQIGNWQTWMGDQWSGEGAGELVETDTMLFMDITAVGHASYSVQIFQEGMTFKNGATYRVSFDAMSADSKTSLVNVGRALSVDPWWTGYAPTQTFVFGPEMQTYSFDFVMEEETYDLGKVVFELGTIDGDDTLTQVTIDKVFITEVE